jgi:hypothetical protein
MFTYCLLIPLSQLAFKRAGEKGENPFIRMAFACEKYGFSPLMFTSWEQYSRYSYITTLEIIMVNMVKYVAF